MKSVEVKAHLRPIGGKTINNQLRKQGYIPCELYGGNENLHFCLFYTDFKNIVYTPDTVKVIIDIEGKKYETVVQEVQYNPLSEEILHADFLVISDDKKIKIELPIKFVGNSQGVKEGGKLIKKLRSLKVKGYPKDMPEAIDLDITELGLGKSVKVSEIKVTNLEILNSMSNPVATIEIPRGLRGKMNEAAEAAAKGGKKK